jgi:Flp pilus assembly CpaF family ATPase
VSNVEVPIYEAPSFEEQILLGKDQQELVRIQEQLRRYGLELDVQVQMLEGQLPDGRRVVVPIRNVSTRPAGL